jgi:hypothetical protein
MEGQASVQPLVVNLDSNAGPGAVDTEIIPASGVVNYAQLPAPYEAAEEQTQR